MEIATVATADVLARAVVNQPPLRVRYKIEFPPGAMGVELEPVIRSSEKEIGCRVKDYYFPLDHNGVDRHYVESRVAIGDIICSINGEDVKSQSFGLIVDKLKSLKDKRRVISFKNIGASWFGKQEGNMDDKSLPTTPLPVKTSSHHDHIKNLIMSPKSSKRLSSVKTGTNIENELDPTYRISMTQTIKSTSKPPFEIPVTPLKSPNRHIIDNNKRFQEAIYSPSGKTSTNFIQSHEIVLPSPIFSPESTRKIPFHNNDLVSDGIKNEESSKLDGAGALVLAMETSSNNQNLRVQQLLQQISTGLASVGTAALNSLSNQAQEILRHTGTYLPYYSQLELQDIQEKKHALLRELSQSAMKLGRSQEEQLELSQKLQFLEEMILSYQRLLEENERIKKDNTFLDGKRLWLEEKCDSLEVKLKKYETDLVVLQQEKLEDEESCLILQQIISQKDSVIRNCEYIIKEKDDHHQTVLTSLRDSLANSEMFLQSNLEEHSYLQKKHSELQKSYTDLAAIYDKDQLVWKKQMETFCAEQSSTRQEVDSTIQQAQSKIFMLQEELERLHSRVHSIEEEKLKLQERITLEQKNHNTIQLDLTRLQNESTLIKEQNVELNNKLIGVHAEKGRLVEKHDLQLSAVMMDNKEKMQQLADSLTDIMEQMSTIREEKVALEVECQKLISTVAELNSEKAILQESVTSSDNALLQLRDQHLAKEQEHRNLDVCLSDIKLRESKLQSEIEYLASALAQTEEQLLQTREDLLLVQLANEAQEKELTSIKQELSIVSANYDTNMVKQEKQIGTLLSKTLKQAHLIDEFQIMLPNVALELSRLKLQLRSMRDEIKSDKNIVLSSLVHDEQYQLLQQQLLKKINSSTLDLVSQLKDDFCEKESHINHKIREEREKYQEEKKFILFEHIETLQEVNTQYTKLQGEKEVLEQKAKLLEEKTFQLNDEKDILYQQQVQLLSDSHKQLTVLEEDKKVLVFNNQKLEESYQILDIQHKQSCQKNSELERSLSLLRQKHDELNATLVQEIKQLHTAKDEQLKTLQVLNEDYMCIKDEMSKQSANFIAQKSDLSEKLRLLSDQIEALLKDKKSLTVDKDHCMIRYDELAKEKIQIEEKFTIIVEKLQQELQSSRSIIVAKDETLQNMKVEFAQVQQLHASVLDEVEARKSISSVKEQEYTKDIRSLQETLTTLEKQLKEKDIEYHLLQEEDTVMKVKFNELNQENDNWKNKSEILHHCMRRLKEKMSSELLLFKSLQNDLKMEFGTLHQMHQNIVSFLRNKLIDMSRQRATSFDSLIAERKDDASNHNHALLILTKEKENLFQRIIQYEKALSDLEEKYLISYQQSTKYEHLYEEGASKYSAMVKELESKYGSSLNHISVLEADQLQYRMNLEGWKSKYNDCKYEYASLKETTETATQELELKIATQQSLFSQQTQLLEEEKLANLRLNESYLHISTELSKSKLDSLEAIKLLRVELDTKAKMFDEVNTMYLDIQEQMYRVKETVETRDGALVKEREKAAKFECDNILLLEQIQCLQEQCSNFERRASELSRFAEQLQVQKQNCDLENLNNNSANLQQIKQLSDELELQKIEQTKVCAIETSLNKSEEIILELQQKCSSLESNLLAVGLERDKLTRQCTDLRDTVTVNNSKRSKLEKELRDFQLVVQDKDRLQKLEKDKINQEWQEKISSVQEVVMRKETSLQELQNRCIELESKLMLQQTLATENFGLRVEATKLQAELDRLNELSVEDQAKHICAEDSLAIVLLEKSTQTIEHADNFGRANNDQLKDDCLQETTDNQIEQEALKKQVQFWQNQYRTIETMLNSHESARKVATSSVLPALHNDSLQKNKELLIQKEILEHHASESLRLHSQLAQLQSEILLLEENVMTLKVEKDKLEMENWLQQQRLLESFSKEKEDIVSSYGRLEQQRKETIKKFEVTLVELKDYYEKQLADCRNSHENKSKIQHTSLSKELSLRDEMIKEASNLHQETVFMHHNSLNQAEQYYSELAQKYSDLEKKSCYQEQELAMLRDNTTTQLMQFNELHEQSKLCEQELAVVTAKFEDAMKQLSNISQELTLKEQQILLLQQEVENIVTEKTAEISILTADLQTLIGRSESAESTNEEQAVKQYQNEETLAILEVSLASKDLELVRLKELLIDKDNTIENSKTLVGSLEKSLADKDSYLLKMNDSQITQLKEREQILLNSSVLQSQMEEIAQQFLNLQKDSASKEILAQRKLTEKVELISELEQNCESLRANILNLSEERATLRETIVVLSNEKNILSEKYSRMEKKIDAMDLDFGAILKEKEELEEQTAVLKLKKTEMERVMEQQQDLIQSKFFPELTELQQDKLHLQSLVETNESEIHRLKSELDTASEKFRKLEESSVAISQELIEYRDLQSLHSENVIQLEELKKQYSQERNILTEKVKNDKEMSDFIQNELQEQIITTQSELIQLTSSYETLQHTVARYEHDLSSKQYLISDLRGTVKMLQGAVNQAEQREVEHITIKSQLQETISSYQSAISQLNYKLETLQDCFTVLQQASDDEITKLQEIVASKDREMKEKNDEINLVQHHLTSFLQSSSFDVNMNVERSKSKVLEESKDDIEKIDQNEEVFDQLDFKSLISLKYSSTHLHGSNADTASTSQSINTQNVLIENTSTRATTASTNRKFSVDSETDDAVADAQAIVDKIDQWLSSCQQHSIDNREDNDMVNLGESRSIPSISLENKPIALKEGNTTNCMNIKTESGTSNESMVAEMSADFWNISTDDESAIIMAFEDE